jgi:YrbI family 3-deoxy-D-manno-octulosonate 8-phosphate phosphatase
VYPGDPDGPTVAVIPARGGSKGIPEKNLRPVGGTPLVERAIRAALAAPSVDLVVVSTDDRRIAELARGAGAVVVDRPAELSGDEASSESAVLHAIDEIEPGLADPIGICVLVQCTSPFVRGSDIEGVVALVRSGEADSAFTAAESHAFLWTSGDDGLLGVNHDETRRLRRQDRPVELRETGAAYAMTAEGLRRSGHRFHGRIGAHVVPAERGLEIDEEEELRAADLLAPVLDPQPLVAWPNPIGLVAFDFDGVMTDDRAHVLEDGTEGVTVSRSDGMGIELLRHRGLPMVVISKERNPVVARRCEKLAIDCLQGVEDKWTILRRWLDEREVDPRSVIYLGNDVNDLECFRHVGLAVAVADAHPTVLTAADLVLARPGGRGAVRELADLLLARSEGFDRPR